MNKNVWDGRQSPLFALQPIQGAQQAVNSDLSCHELSEAGWEGQSGDDQRDHGGKDEPAGRENNNTNAWDEWLADKM